MDLTHLSERITALDTSLRQSAVGAVSRLHTMRNWLIGWHIVEYEQNGEDRAEYGAELTPTLSLKLAEKGLKGMSATNLRLFRQFYKEYPQLASAIARVSAAGIAGEEICQALPDKSAFSRIHQALPDESYRRLSPEPEKLLRHFSYTHFIELIKIREPVKRAFYEIEGIRGCWNYRQLKRQIESLLYERTGMSKDKRGLVDEVHAERRVMTIDEAIRDPYLLEFAGFPEDYRFSEHDLETRLLDHIQSFLLELGNGFCFEARQKRITIDNEHDRIDLVFYHRILRCHVLIDLKVRKFEHGDAGQMNFYLNYYRENEMAEGDNPPVGLILCTSRDQTHVKYATSGMDNRLFVSKYLTALPSEEKLMQFLQDDRDYTENVLREERAVYRP